jgi:hypothetical protein
MPADAAHVTVNVTVAACADDDDTVEPSIADVLSAITELRSSLMAQIDDLRAAIDQVGVDLAEAVTRIENRINELGDPDPDLTVEIAKLRDISTTLDSTVAGEPTEPTVPTEPTEPDTTPDTPPPTEPGTPDTPLPTNPDGTPAEPTSPLSPEPGSGDTV